MNTTTPRSFFSGLGRKALAVAGLGLLLSVAPALRADVYYTYTLNTAALDGTSGVLAFDLIGGDDLAGNNTASIMSLSVTGGSLADPGAFTMMDTNFFNEELRDIDFGTSLSFTMLFSNNFAGGTPDSFSFFVLDPIDLLPLYATSDPTQSGALFLVEMNGGRAVGTSTYDGALSVPETSSTFALLAVGLVGFAGVRRRLVRVAA